MREAICAMCLTCQTWQQIHTVEGTDAVHVAEEADVVSVSPKPGIIHAFIKHQLVCLKGQTVDTNISSKYCPPMRVQFVLDPVPG